MASQPTPGTVIRVLAVDRISIDREGLGINVGRHVDTLLDHVHRRRVLGWHLVDIPGSPKPGGGQFPAGVLVDNDVSVSTTGRHKQAAEHERAIGLALSGQVDIIVTTSLARLWRSAITMAPEIRKLAKAGVTLETLHDGTWNLQTAMGRSLIMIVGILAQMEAEIIQERARSTMVHAAQRGAYHGARPFGYVHAVTGVNGGREAGNAGDGGADRRTLLPLWGGPDHEAAAAHRLAVGQWPAAYIPSEADLVVEMAQRIDKGEPVYRLLKDFDARCFPTATGKSWTEVGQGSVNAIVTAPRNIGKRRHVVSDYDEETGATTVVSDTLYDAGWDPILPEDLYERVCAKLNPATRRTAPGNARKYLLVGFAVCGKCGAKLKSGHLTGKKETTAAVRLGRRTRLLCPPPPRGCGGLNRDMADAEDVVVTQLANWMVAGGRYDQETAANRAEVMQAQAAAADTETAGALADKALHERALKKAKLDLVYERITDADYDDLAREIHAKIAAAEARLPAPPAEPGNMLADWPRGEAFVARWADLEACGDPDSLTERRRVLTQLVEKVVLLPAPPSPACTGASRRAGPEYTVVYPGKWLCGWEPDPAPLTTDEIVTQWLTGQDGRRTRTEIAVGTGLNPATVHNIVQRLISSGTVNAVWERTRTKAGRAAYTYQVAAPVIPATVSVASG